MELPVKIRNCIICRKNKTGNPEHIIPEYIGGVMTARILCDDCNNYFGSSLISKIKNDPFFHFAILNLQNDIPDIYTRYFRNVEYIGYSGDGSTVTLYKKGNNLRILPKQDGDYLTIDPSMLNDFIKSI